MDYKETSELVEKVVDKAVESYTRAMSELIASEMGGLKKELSYVNDNTRTLADQFTKMNGKLRDVCEWKAQHVEETNSFKEKLSNITASRVVRLDYGFRIVQMIVLVVSVTFAIYFGAENIRLNKEKAHTEQEETK